MLCSYEYCRRKLFLNYVLGIKEPFKKGSADIVVIGEGDQTMLEVCNALLKTQKTISEIEGIAYQNKGDIIKTKSRPLIEDINKLPSPNPDLIPIKKYYTNLHYSTRLFL